MWFFGLIGLGICALMVRAALEVWRRSRSPEEGRKELLDVLAVDNAYIGYRQMRVLQYVRPADGVVLVQVYDGVDRSQRHEAALLKMEDEGIDTGFFRGAFEDVLRKLGKTTDPKLVKYKNKMMSTLIKYRRAATGVQFSPIESKQYQQMLPNYGQEYHVNLASIDGMIEAMQVNDRSFWSDRLGSEEAAAWLSGSGPALGSSSGGGGKLIELNIPGVKVYREN